MVDVVTPAPPAYGLDIETDTATGGLDPTTSAVLAVAVDGPRGTRVFTGPEPVLLAGLDAHLAALPAGVLVTWNGSSFDLPFLADRAVRAGVSLGLRLAPDTTAAPRRNPIPGHPLPYRASWYGHDHLDAYRVYRGDVGASLRLSCSLKSIAGLVGLDAVEVDASAVHLLDADALGRYVSSDARLARELALRRWGTAAAWADQLVGTAPAGP